MRLIDTPIGYLDFDGNELTVGSKIDDPPKIRMTNPAPGGSYGCISGNRTRADGSQLEKVLLILKPDDASAGQQHEGGSYDFFAQLAGTEDDAGMVRVKTLTTQFEETYVPVIGTPVGGSRFYSPNGRYCWNYQNDGHQVQYDTHNSTDESTWTAVWSNWFGLLRPLPWG